jgi:hypothetical protein
MSEVSVLLMANVKKQKVLSVLRKYHAARGMHGETEIYLQAFLVSALFRSGQFYVPAAIPAGKELKISIEDDGEWSRASLDAVAH